MKSVAILSDSDRELYFNQAADSLKKIKNSLWVFNEFAGGLIRILWRRSAFRQEFSIKLHHRQSIKPTIFKQRFAPF